MEWRLIRQILRKRIWAKQRNFCDRDSGWRMGSIKICWWRSVTFDESGLLNVRCEVVRGLDQERVRVDEKGATSRRGQPSRRPRPRIFTRITGYAKSSRLALAFAAVLMAKGRWNFRLKYLHVIFPLPIVKRF